MYCINEYIKKNHIDESILIGRVVEKNNYLYTVAFKDGLTEVMEAVQNLSSSHIFVGDYIEYIQFGESKHIITSVMDRETTVSKQVSHASKSYNINIHEQIFEANVDQLFIILAADQWFTLSKSERYVLTFDRPNIDLHVLISKGDYLEKAEKIKNEIEAV